MRAIVGLVFVLLVSCTSVASRVEREREQVASELRARAGSELEALDEARAKEWLAQPLGPDQAVAVALALDPRAREALAELDISSARRVRSGLIRNPALQLGLARLDGETDLDLDLMQPLAELLTLGARVERAEGELLAERARAARALVRLVHDVRRDWLDAALAERAEVLARERVEAEAAATRLADELHRAGNVVDSVLTLSQLALADARSRLALAETRTTAARERLARHLGIDGAQVELAPVPELALPRVLSGGFATKVEAASLELQEARARVEASAHAAGVARWDVLLERSSLGLTARKEEGREGAGPTLALTLPLFDDGSAASAEARARLAVALARHASLELELRESVHTAESRFAASVERVRLARDEHAPAASRHLDEVLRQYNAMQVGVFDVLDARRGELDAQESALQLERELRLVSLDLDELLAGSLPSTRRNPTP